MHKSATATQAMKVFDILVLSVVVQSLTLPIGVHGLASALGYDAPQLVRRDTEPYPGSSGEVANGCSPQGTGTPGFRAVFYPYTHYDQTTNRNVTYMEVGYLSDTPTATVDGVTNPEFSGIVGPASVSYADIYGHNTTVSNFGLQLTGYFLATESGLWTLGGYADDTAMVRLGGGIAFQCCSVTTITTGAYAVWYNFDPPAYTWQLTKGYYYPILIFYTQQVTNYKFILSMTSPSGVVITDFTNNVFTFPDTTICPAAVTTTVPWTGTFTSTATNSPSSSGTVLVTVYEPDPRVTTTVYGPGTAESTTTINPDDGVSGTVSVIVSEPYKTTTTTSYWTDSTFSTTTIFPASGDITETVEIFAPGQTTITTPWTGADYSTTTLPLESGGVTTVEVFSPDPRVTTTRYGSVSGTYTETLYPSGPSGTISVIVSEPYITTTLTSYWTGSYEYTTTEPVASSDITVTVIDVVPTMTPETHSHSQTTTTSIWTGTSTYTTTETAASSDGIDTVIIVVPTTSCSFSTVSLSSVKPASLPTFSLGFYWNSSTTTNIPDVTTSSGETKSTVLTTTTIPVTTVETSTVPCEESTSTNTIPGTAVVTSTVPCDECAQSTPTSGGSANSQSSQVRPSATSGRESIISSITSGEHGESACTDCKSTLVSSKTQASSGSPGHATASSKGAFPLTSSPALSSSATVVPSVSVLTPSEGAASQQRLAWALAFGVLLYFV